MIPEGRPQKLIRYKIIWKEETNFSLSFFLRIPTTFCIIVLLNTYIWIFIKDEGEKYWKKLKLLTLEREHHGWGGGDCSGDRSISVSIAQSNLIQFEGKDRDFVLLITSHKTYLLHNRYLKIYIKRNTSRMME